MSDAKIMADRIKRWCEQDAGKEDEHRTDLLCDAEEELRKHVDGAVEALAEVLASKEEELRVAKLRIRELEREIDLDQLWTSHQERDYDAEKNLGLPIPRLEIVWNRLSNDHRGYPWEMRYDLVMRHLLGHVEVVPLGHTRTSREPTRDPVRNGKLEKPFRDYAHICYDAMHLGLPAYVRWGDRVEQIDPEEHAGAMNAINVHREE